MRLTYLPSILLSCLFLALLWAPGLRADLYVGQGSLDETSADTDQALMRALDEVLVRLTGRVDTDMTARLGLRPASARALVESQQRVEVMLPDQNGELQRRLRLQVEFDSAAVDRLIAQAGLARWGRERPAILLWVALDDDSGTRLVSDPGLDQLIREQARRFGLDVLRPLGDGMDLAEVQVSDVRGGFLDAAEGSLERYRAGVPAMLDLRVMPEQVSGRWFWRQDGLDRSANLSARTQAEVIERGLAAVLESLSGRYAQRPATTDDARLEVVVGPILDEVQFAEVLRYLGQLSMVESVRVTGARGREISFLLSLRSGGLVDAIELGGLLRLAGRADERPLVLVLDR